MADDPKNQSYGYGHSFNETMKEIRQLPRGQRSVFGLRYEAEQRNRATAGINAAQPSKASRSARQG